MLDLRQSAPARLSDHDRPVAAHRWILAAAWGIWCTGFYSLTLLSFLLPPIQKALGASEGDLATLTAVGVGMTGAGGLLFGWMSDRLGRRLAMAVSIAAFSLGNAACAFAPGFGWLLAARALVGFGVGGSWGAGQAMLGETIPPALRGHYGAIAQTGAPSGLGLATIMGSFVAPVLGWRTVFLLSAAPVLALLVWSRLPESDLWL
ncbi:MAG TPA: MFS transporter, partial [Thermoanaerobaculia bacterium]|nr:MFS transporter [Thermoanaerobaculia bacterium]